ncbi:RNA-binding protein 7-like [Aedes aegypti]|uniref:Putative splicing factor 3b subunit 4 n=1 Tax=Aedes aegypti TaxID=7159 RepID=A0A0P6J4K1_AEDAE|nr:RNA-binding protein 7-like [Aedes aegypti]
MSEEDERTLWCGNLAEKVTEELLYELFLQAGPVEMVKIPQDKDKRPRSFAFITFAHGASVEYAMNIFDGTRLFNRQLTIHKKSKNGQNAGSPKVNNPQQNRGQQQQQQQQQHQQMNLGNMPNLAQMQFANMSPGAMTQMMMQGMINQLSQQVLANMGNMPQNMQQNKMNRNDRQQHQQQKPYSRERDRDRGDNFSGRDRNEGGDQMFSRDRGNGRGDGNKKRRNEYRGRR